MAEILSQLHLYFPLYFPVVLLGVILILSLCIGFSGKNRMKRKIRKLKKKSNAMTPEEFFALRSQKIGEKSVGTEFNFSGVYIIYNKTKNMYYVGQAVKIFDRVNNHFTGHGNGDVYADYKYKDKFEINLIPLEGSGCKTLNELERKTIETYHAYGKGYNKTRGNQG